VISQAPAQAAPAAVMTPFGMAAPATPARAKAPF